MLPGHRGFCADASALRATASFLGKLPADATVEVHCLVSFNSIIMSRAGKVVLFLEFFEGGEL
jgi:hypothetical protein